MANRIQIRRDTAANWTSVNPVLASGEEGLETDTGNRKLGDGVTAWSSLGYQAPNAATLSATYVPGFAPSSSIVYNGSGQVTSATENGITTTYTYNTDGTVNTETRLGKVRTWVYDGNGNPTSSTVV